MRKVKVSEISWVKDVVRSIRASKRGSGGEPIKQTVFVEETTELHITPPLYDWGYKEYYVRDPNGHVRYVGRSASYDTFLTELFNRSSAAKLYQGGTIPLPEGFEVLVVESTGRGKYLWLYRRPETGLARTVGKEVIANA